jgi:hypothetical protein
MDLILHFLLSIAADSRRKATRKAVANWTSCRRAIPEFDRLLEEPDVLLEEQSIPVGPTSHLFGDLFLSLFVGVLGLPLLLVLYHLADVPRDSLPWVALVLFFPLFLITFLLTRLRVPHTCNLTRKGVEFRRGSQLVFCPWSLFQRAGQPFLPENRSRVILPIAAGALTEVVQTEEEREVARGQDARHSSLQWRSRTELLLFSRYAVDPEELGRLLLFLGRVLGDPVPSAQQSSESPAAAVVEERRSAPSRWVKILLTAPHFPEGCCSCLEPAERTHAFTFQEGREKKEVPIPWCDGCQGRYRGRIWKAGLLVGLGTTLVSLILLCVSGLAGELLVGVVLALIFGTVLGGFVGLVMSDLHRPVKLRYDATRLELSARFKNQQFAEEVRALQRSLE